MNLAEYIESRTEPLKEATLCLLIKDDQVLLAMKKRGFGVGKYNGTGGKKNPDESIEEAAIREAREEIGVNISKLKHVATFEYYFPHNDFGQKVTVFMVDEWEGDPSESEEMKPEWFPQNQIPFHSMWSDDEYWMPLVLEGKRVFGQFMFDESGATLEHKLNIEE